MNECVMNKIEVNTTKEWNEKNHISNKRKDSRIYLEKNARAYMTRKMKDTTHLSQEDVSRRHECEYKNI